MSLISRNVPACLALLLVVGCEESAEPVEDVVRPVKAMAVSAADAIYRRSFPGRSRAVQEVELSFRVSGPLTELPVNIGDEVSTGDLVARIDGRDYEVQVREARGRLSEAEASLKRSSADLDRLLAVFAEDPGATSQAAIDEARESRDRARANVATATASLNSAEDDLEDTFLRAPFDGAVVSKYIENFEDVQAKQPVLRIVDDSQLEMVINIPESLISVAGDARNLRVTFDAFPENPLPARITEIGTEASETTRTYPVTVAVDQPEEFRVLSGMAGQVTGDPPEGLPDLGLVLPVAALVSEGNNSFVWVVDESTGVISKRGVELGEFQERGQTVTSGISEGEWVVTAGASFLTEGQRVRILDSEGG
ncbi:MAG: efflux RND transporter periplasmic adaptor subunit [Pseudomonadota bacterium]